MMVASCSVANRAKECVLEKAAFNENRMFYERERERFRDTKERQ
jgi:hypothetical protein